MVIKRFYSIKEVADLFALSYSGIYNMVQAGEIPSTRIGTAIRIPAEWVSATRSGSGVRCPGEGGE